MTRAVLVKGKLISPRQVELAEPVSTVNAEVEVLVRASAEPHAEDSWAEYLSHLPPGKRSQAEIDAQVQSEREAWGDARRTTIASTICLGNTLC